MEYILNVLKYIAVQYLLIQYGNIFPPNVEIFFIPANNFINIV